MTITTVDCFVATVSRSPNPVVTPISKLGGQPVFVARIESPHCRSCGQPMDFLGQFRLDTPLPLSRHYQMAYVFMCPGKYDDRGWLVCPTFEPFSGANALLLQTDRGPALMPEISSRYLDYTLTLKQVPEPDIDVSEFDLDEALRMQVSYTTKIGGVPAWIQANETPNCPHCGRPMRFVGQIDASPDGRLPADISQWKQYHFFDFGDVGLGYVFICPNDCSPNGAFLWQCS